MAQMDGEQAMHAAAIAERRGEKAAAAQVQIGEGAAGRCIHRIERTAGQVAGERIAWRTCGTQDIPAGRRPAKGKLDAPAVARQAGDLPVIVEHPGRRCAPERQGFIHWQTRHTRLPRRRQRQCAGLGIPDALAAALPEIGLAGEQQKAGPVAVHGSADVGNDGHRHCPAGRRTARRADGTRQGGATRRKSTRRQGLILAGLQRYGHQLRQLVVRQR